MRVFGFLVVSTAFLLNGTVFSVAQNTPNVMVMETVPASANDIHGPVHSGTGTGLSVSQSAQKPSPQRPQTIGSRPTVNPSASDTPPHILKAGDFDLAYIAYDAGDYQIAFDEAKKRADIGDPAAMTLIGMLYSEGQLFERNSDIASEWFKRAADLGDPHAALYYGINIFNATIIEDEKQIGADYIKKSAEAGVPRANYYYAQILNSLAPEKDKLDIALVWYLKGAVARDTYSLYAAAEILAVGTDRVKPDEYAARALLESAANMEDVAARLELAKWMMDGRGGPVDKKGAFTLVKLVALSNAPTAQLALARFYFNGIGVEKDPIMGASWYLLAQQGKQGAADLDALVKQLSPQQLSQARARINTLLFNP